MYSSYDPLTLESFDIKLCGVSKTLEASLKKQEEEIKKFSSLIQNFLKNQSYEYGNKHQTHVENEVYLEILNSNSLAKKDLIKILKKKIRQLIKKISLN